MFDLVGVRRDRCGAVASLQWPPLTMWTKQMMDAALSNATTDGRPLVAFVSFDGWPTTTMTTTTYDD